MVAISLSMTARARADIPPPQQALVLLRALAYDDNLKARAGGNIVLAVVYKSGNGASEQMADGMTRAFKDLEGVKVQDLPFRAIKLAFSDKDGIRAQIAAQGIDALYVCVGLDNELSAITEVSRAAHVLSIAGREEYVERGASLGVFLRSGKPTMVVNAAASRAEAVAFSSQLLRIAEIVR